MSKAENKPNFKKRIFDIIQIGYRNDLISRLFDLFIVAVIIINIAVTFIETFDQVQPYMGILHTVEFVTILIFLGEYILRIWTAEYLFPDRKPTVARMKFLLSFYGLVDCLTILPYFLPFFFPSGAVAFRMFRVVRIFHLFRVNSNYDAFNVITEVIKEKKDQLFSSIFLILILLVASSLCMYGLEHDAQPENFSNAFSGIWWSVSTLLTVGYGDIYPVTVGGRLMAIFIAFLGVGVVAIPTGIISAGFVEYYSQIKKGTYAQKEASFATLDIKEGHPFVGHQLKEVNIPVGLYPAVIMRGEDVYTPTPNFEFQKGDCLMLGSVGRVRSDCTLEEIVLAGAHPWIGQRVKDLDISRRSYVVMIRREDKNIRPQDDTVFKQDDTVMILER